MLPRREILFNVKKLAVGKYYKQPEIQAVLGGPLGFFPAKKGNPVPAYCAFKPQIDKGAPKILVLSDKWAEKGDALAKARVFIPFFKFIQKGKWEYIGEYRLRESNENPQIVRDEAERGQHDQQFKYCLVLYLESRGEAEAADAENLATTKLAPTIGSAFQPDQARKVAVEIAAMQKTTECFKDWKIEDVSDKNKGWDLEATKDLSILYLEVKGLSGSEIAVELTPNEYKRMQERAEQYRVCVVRSALSSDAAIHIFRYRAEMGDLIDEQGNRLAINEVVAAHLTAI